MPLLRVSGLPAVAVSINKSKPAPFVIDMAANLLAISPAEAATLRLRRLGLDETGNQAVRVDDLAIGGAHFRGLVATADPFLIGHEEAGVIGLNVYSHATLAVDFVRNTVTISTNGLPAANGHDVIAYRPSAGGGPTVPVRVCALTVWANVDTAAPAALRLPASMMDSLGCGHQVLSTEAVVGAQSGPMQVTNARVFGNISIANLTFKQPVVRFGPGSAIFVGDGLLNSLAVTLDQAHRRIRFARPTKP